MIFAVLGIPLLIFAAVLIGVGVVSFFKSFFD